MGWTRLVVLAAVVGCGGGSGGDEPIRIGLLTPKSGSLQSVGESFERVATTAVLMINEQGGIDGHPLVLVVKDTGSDPVQARIAMQEMVSLEGVVAVIGPARSDEVDRSYDVARDFETPMISPSSTAASLITVDDGGYLFRNVPNDNLQGIFQAYYLAVAPSGPMITTAAIMYEVGQYGQGLADSFEAAFERACVGCDVPDTHIVTFAAGLPQATADAEVANLQALQPPPEYVMMVALEQDGAKLVNGWDPADSDPALPGLQWFMTDGVRSAGFLQNIPPSMVGMRGTAPTVPMAGAAYGVMVQAYEARNSDDIDQQVFAANVWDAVYLIAAGLAVQAGDQAGVYGGPGLRDAIAEVSRGPGQIFHAGQWPNLVGAILSGSEVDYDGAAGPNDFDQDGEARGPYEVWRIIDGGAGYEFEQELFLEASDVEDLLP